MRKKRIGIYGGTFSPPHNGHVLASEEFVKCADLDELIITVTWTPPHKQADNGSTPYQRLEMATLAFAGVEKATVSDYEIEKKGISYTKDTLEHFKEENNELFLLTGDDMFLTLDTWYQPEKIFSLATVVCFPRQRGDAILRKIEKKRAEYTQVYGARIITPEYTPYPLSSTQIRNMAASGEDISDFVCPEVMEYIKKNGLYRS